MLDSNRSSIIGMCCAQSLEGHPSTYEVSGEKKCIHADFRKSTFMNASRCMSKPYDFNELSQGGISIHAPVMPLKRFSGRHYAVHLSRLLISRQYLYLARHLAVTRVP